MIRDKNEERIFHNNRPVQNLNDRQVLIHHTSNKL